LEKLGMLLDTVPWVAAITAIGVGGWLLHTWMRIKHGYPLDGAWGQAIYPTKDNETVERIRLLTTENAQLRAELGAIKDRLQNVERIVTDQPSQLAREIEQLQ